MEEVDQNIEYETDEEDGEVLKVRAENEVLQSIIVSLEQQIERLSSQLSDSQQLVAIEKEVVTVALFIFISAFIILVLRCTSIFLFLRILEKWFPKLKN